MPHKESNSHALATELDADTDQLPNKRQKIKTNEDTATAEEQLLDDDIDWHASSSYADVEAVSEAADDPTDAHHHSVPDVNDGMQATCHSPQDPGATAEAPGVMQSDVMKQDPDCKRIQHAVNEYIRAFLDPFYKAGIVNKEVGRPPSMLGPWANSAERTVVTCSSCSECQTRPNTAQTQGAHACTPSNRGQMQLYRRPAVCCRCIS